MTTLGPKPRFIGVPPQKHEKSVAEQSKGERRQKSLFFGSFFFPMVFTLADFSTYFRPNGLLDPQKTGVF